MGSGMMRLVTETPQRRDLDTVLADAVRVLTEAARLTRGEDRQQIDWAGFVAEAVCSAAANFGGVDRILAGRPGSWEADYLRRFMFGTVGWDEQDLASYRTEPADEESAT
jgi:hypothetical protein